MSIRIKSEPVPVAQRICADCQNAAVCKYRDKMDEVRTKLLDLTTKNEAGVAEIDLGVHFDMFLGCTHFRSNLNTVNAPEIDLYWDRIGHNKQCGTSDRTTPIDLATK